MPVRELVVKIDPSVTITSVEKIDVQMLEFFRDLLETLQHFNLDYITGPDIGVPKRVIAIDGTTDPAVGVLLMINPSIAVETEDALIVEYNDLSGIMRSVSLSGDLAKYAKRAFDELGE